MEDKLIEALSIDMKNFGKYIFIIVILFSMESCKFLDSEDYLIANSGWFMDTIESNGKDVKYQLMGNALIFSEKYCSVPLTQVGMNKGDDEATWHIDEENHIITITSKNPYFNGTFEFCFRNHKEDNVVELYMVSDSISILAHSPNKMESGLLELPFLCIDE
ncbi:MAG: hypothetical protein AB3N16_12850 [Flavobacteriaceae bacterium]